jgi:hypothetical protein
MQNTICEIKINKKGSQTTLDEILKHLNHKRLLVLAVVFSAEAAANLTCFQDWCEKGDAEKYFSGVKVPVKKASLDAGLRGFGEEETITEFCDKCKDLRDMSKKC